MVANGSAPDLWEVMRTARAIRRFTERPVDDALLATCLEAATWAPSGGNQQPWHFVVMKSAAAREALTIGAARRWRSSRRSTGSLARSPMTTRRVPATHALRTRCTTVLPTSLRRCCSAFATCPRRHRSRSAVRSFRRCRTSFSPSGPQASVRASPAGTWTPTPSSVWPSTFRMTGSSPASSSSAGRPASTAHCGGARSARSHPSTAGANPSTVEHGAPPTPRPLGRLLPRRRRDRAARSARRRRQRRVRGARQASEAQPGMGIWAESPRIPRRIPPRYESRPVRSI